VRRVSLTLVAKILPVLGGVAIAMYMSWCMAISMVGGPIPLVGWTLEGGFWTFLLWGLVHGGYLAAVDLLWNDVSAAVRQLRDREQKLLLTGHSMGGALAVLAAARFEVEDMIPVEPIYTFGQPAVAEPAFSSELERRPIAEWRRRVVHVHRAGQCARRAPSR
jgi:pimeloyl-ACP methyl ester carboxylesterase